MIRNKREERKRRLSTKTLDEAFRKEVEEGLNCSPVWNNLMRGLLSWFKRMRYGLFQ